MIETLAKATLGFAAIIAAWLAVMTAWRRAFPGHADPHGDVLTPRSQCRATGGDCSCTSPCATSPSRPLNNQLPERSGA